MNALAVAVEGRGERETATSGCVAHDGQQASGSWGEPACALHRLSCGREDARHGEQTRMLEELRDELVVLRPFSLVDIADLFTAARESIDSVHSWLPWCHPEYALAESEEWVRKQVRLWEREEEFSFVVRDHGGTFVGGCGLNQINRIHLIANLGYWTRAGQTGRGYATAAARLVARFGIEQVGLQRIEIVAAVGNVASQRVAQRAGAIREGVLRNRLHLHGESCDAVMFSITPADMAG